MLMALYVIYYFPIIMIQTNRYAINLTSSPAYLLNDVQLWLFR